MAAPSGTVWGSIITGSSSGRKGRIGIYTGVSNTNTQTTVNVQVWFWTIYSCDDGADNTLYYNVGTSVSSATTSVATDIDISHTIASGEGWNTANQTRLLNKTYTYDRGKSDVVYKAYARFTGIDMLYASSSMYANTTYTVPALDSYTITYDANGGSGAPSAQIKYYGINLTLSSTKPTRSGYTFQGWGTSTSDTSIDYNPGATYSANASDTLYAIWKAITYTITYNANGGTGAPAAQTKTHGTPLLLSGTIPKRDGYTFVGWGRSSGATAVAYAPGATYSTEAGVTLYAIWKVGYTNPKITKQTVYRSDANGATNDSGTYAVVSFNWSTSLSVSSITIEWKTSYASSWSSAFVSASGTSGSVSAIIGDGVLEAESSYEIRITVSDSSGSFNRMLNLAGQFFTTDEMVGGRGYAFGKVADRNNYLDVNFRTLHRKQVEIANNEKIYGVNPDGSLRDALNAQNENGNTVLGYGNYDAGAGNTNIYGYDINIGISNIASPGYYRPYRRRGDTLSLEIRTAGFVTNAGQDVNFFIPFSVPIVGTPTVTVASGNGFILRQGNSYTHGSASSTWVVPSSYTVLNRYQWHGLVIKAVFSNTTNVTNNDAIGIQWSGTITLS